MAKLKLRKKDICYSCMCNFVILTTRRNFKQKTFKIYAQCPKCFRSLDLTRKLALREERQDRRGVKNEMQKL